MNTKDLIKQALDAQIAGDKAGFAAAMKQVVSTKTSKMVSEMAGSEDGAPAPQEEGEYIVHLESYDYNGTDVSADLGVNIGHYQAATQGNYSQRASDPSEYYGDDEEVEWNVVSATLTYDDGHEEKLFGEEAAALEFSDEECATITQNVLEQQKSKADDDIDYERSYDF